MPTPVHIIGASGRSGLALCDALRADHLPFTPIIRNPARWPDPEPARIADLANPTTLKTALAGATSIVSCAHARHAGVILAAAPPGACFIFLGSTRKFTRWPDAHGNGVIAGEIAFLTSGRPGVMLHPTMIYGAQGEDNVQRLAALLRRLLVIPLPAGGRALVQPIHQDDVIGCIRAALARDWTTPQALVIAGPEPIPYVDFVRAIAQASGATPRPIITIPSPILGALAGIARTLPRLPKVQSQELRRLMEDKAFDTAPMRRELGIEPISLAEGLARTFSPPQAAGHAHHQPHR